MLTQKAMAMANRRNESDSDDDEAPEVVSKASAEEQALERLRQEEAAVIQQQQAEAAKSKKRKARSAPAQKEEEQGTTNEGDANTDTNKADVPDEHDDDEASAELPEDVLSALATRDEEEREEQAIEENRERERRKRSTKPRTHIRDFGTVQVQTLDALAARESRRIPDAAMAFMERRSAPHRARMNVLDGHASQFSKRARRVPQA